MKPTISKTTPSILPSPGKLQRRAWGLMHMVLCHISKWYSWWYGISFDGRIIELPFGLILKWSDRTSKEEAAAMQMARAAGMPVPKVISCGEHPNEPYNHFWSILMTRLPGISLENSYDLPMSSPKNRGCLNWNLHGFHARMGVASCWENLFRQRQLFAQRTGTKSYNGPFCQRNWISWFSSEFCPRPRIW
jgi:hypothetical protein